MGVTVGKTKKKHGTHKGGKKKKISGIKVGSPVTVGKPKKKSKKRHHTKGMGMIPRDGMGRYLVQIALGAAGYVAANIVRNTLIPKWVDKNGNPMIGDPQDIFVITAVGAGLMYLDRKGQNEIFYIGLGMAGYGVGEFAVDHIPGLGAIANFDTTDLEKKIAGIIQDKKVGSGKRSYTIGAPAVTVGIVRRSLI
jgi:hypothetical protein